MIMQEIVKKKKKNRELIRFNINFIRGKQCVSCQVTVMSHKLDWEIKEIKLNKKVEKINFEF